MWPDLKRQPLYGVLVVVLLLGAIAWEFAAVSSKMRQHRFIGQPVPQTRQISVTGTGKARGAPDIAAVQAGMTVQGADARTTQAEANRTMTALVDAVKRAGVAPEDVQTSGFSMQPRYDYRSPTPRITGFEAQQMITIRIRDLDRISEVLAVASGAGATNISGLQFTMNDPKRIEDEARGLAIADARTQALRIAQQLGVELGRPLAFTESGGSVPPMPMRAYALEGMGGGDAVPAPSIERGTTEIVANVTVTYELR